MAKKKQPKFITVKKSLFDNTKFGIKIRVGDLVAIDENGVYYTADGNRYEPYENIDLNTL